MPALHSSECGAHETTARPLPFGCFDRGAFIDVVPHLKWDSKGDYMAEAKDVVLAPITPVPGNKLKVDLSYKLHVQPERSRQKVQSCDQPFW